MGALSIYNICRLSKGAQIWRLFIDIGIVFELIRGACTDSASRALGLAPFQTIFGANAPAPETTGPPKGNRAHPYPSLGGPWGGGRWPRELS